MALRCSDDIFRFAGAGFFAVVFVPLCCLWNAAHRAFCAVPMRLRAAALILRRPRLGGALVVAAVVAPCPFGKLA